MVMVILFAPRILAFNSGRILRNIALWLAIFLGLALIYQNIGPESAHPLFQLPESMSGMHSPAIDKDGGEPSGSQGFTPPKE